jgi:hypothetical protein
MKKRKKEGIDKHHVEVSRQVPGPSINIIVYNFKTLLKNWRLLVNFRASRSYDKINPLVATVLIQIS